MIEESIFREYDIRGVYGKELTDDACASIGRAFGRLLVEKESIEKPRVAVGRDCRESCGPIFEALVRGLSSWGVEVVDLGLCPTPLLYFSLHTRPLSGGIMITASHNPSEYNGFKVCVGKDTLFGAGIRELYGLAKDPGERGVVDRPARVTREGVIEDYIRFIVEKFSHLRDYDGGEKIRVVVDSGNGTAGVVAPGLFRALGIPAFELFSEPDGSFPNHHPDPTVEENLVALKGKMRDVGADLGIAFDGDADRLGVIDDRGRTIWGDQLMVLFARDVLKEEPGAAFIGEVKCSQTMYDEIEKLGGKPIMWKTGHSLIKRKMKETGALLAGEMSGHIFFKHRYFGYDDAIYAAVRLVELLMKEREEGAGLTLADMVDNLPKICNTPEIRLPSSDGDKFRIIEILKKNMSGRFDFSDVDGVRVNFENGWGLVRASNTQPALILRFESDSEEGLGEIESILMGELDIAKADLKG
jgi:phosphomannomutase/phosphoglucomutase